MYFCADEPLVSRALTGKCSQVLALSTITDLSHKIHGQLFLPDKSDNQSPDPVNAVTKWGF